VTDEKRKVGFEKYEQDCERIRNANEQLLDEFDAWLKSSGLSEKTINNHVWLEKLDRYNDDSIEDIW